MLLDFLGSNQHLLRELVRRDIKDRHVGQFLGGLWAFLMPMILVLIYVFIFAFVFPARFEDDGQSRNFALSVLAGLVSWLPLQDCMIRSCEVFRSNAGLVKQIVFPVSLLPLKVVFGSLIPYVGALGCSALFGALSGTLSWRVVFLPLLFVAQIALMIGFARFFSLISLYVRDLREIITVFCSVNLFLTPILYNPNSVPENIRGFLWFNPFSYPVWAWQEMLFRYSSIRPASIVGFVLFAAIVFLMGQFVFLRLQDSIGDAL